MKLFFRKFGQGEPLLILHGLFGSGSNWQTPARQLAEHFTVYLVDLRNHGRSPWHPEHTYSAMAADVQELLDDENLTSAHLLGHSMGGKVAMWFALHWPQRVKRLIVVDIAPRRYKIIHLDILRALQALPLASITSRQDAMQYLQRHIPDQGIVQFLLQNLVREGNQWRWRVNLDAIAANLEAISGWDDAEGKVFEGPTLFIRGKLSDYISPEDFAMIRKSFPRARFVTIPGAGHWVHVDQPQRFLQTIQYFLTH